MAQWEVVSQSPSTEFEQRWQPVSEAPATTAWQPVEQTPVAAAPAPAAPAEPSFLDHLKGILNQTGSAGVEGAVKEAANEGRNALPGMLRDMIYGVATIPQRAIEGSQQDVATMGSGEHKASVEPAAEAAMVTLPLRKTVGGVRAHPTDAPAAARVEPPVVDPLAPPEAPSKPVEAPSSAPDAALAPPEATPERLTGARKAARAVQNLLNPDEVSPMAQSAAADIRAAGGKAARDTETTRAALDAESSAVAALDDTEKLGLINYIENRSKTIPEDPTKIHDVYHGTDTAFEHFDPSKLGEYTNAPSAKEGFFFSKSPETADTYTKRFHATKEEMSPERRTKIEALEAQLAQETAPGVRSTRTKIRALEDEIHNLRYGDEAEIIYGEGSNVRPARLKMDNPYVYDFKGARFRDKSYSGIIKEAKAKGHDGVIFENTYDGGPLDTVYAVFDPKQIKTKFEKFDEPGAIVRPELVPVADAVKTAMDARRAKLEKLSSTEKMEFVQDYYTHLWKDPEAAARDIGGPSKEGSGRFLKERSIPTVSEGIARGLEPVSLNPLETTMRYVQSMDRFIATKEVMDKALKDGTVKHFTPGEQPPGWIEVNTRKAGGQGPVYAPADWARVYNNFVDRGIHAWSEDLGHLYDGARKVSNSVTALELGLSGFHAATMAQEALVNGVAKGIGELAAGKPISAVKSLVKTPVTPVSNVLKGRELEHVYLGKKQGTPLMREITDLLTEAGGRAKGMKHAPEYEYSAGGSYWDSFKQGQMGMELRAADAEYAGKGLAGTGAVAVKQTFRQVGRILQTVAKPLFEYTIPKLKNGAFYDNMASWMEANPAATRAEQLKAARKIWDSIDNRFGETVQDNIFWNKTLKQALQLSLRSYSWTFGTIQEIGGGLKDIARHPTSLSPKSQHYSPKAAYVIALPIVYGTLNAVYQKLKTGKDPESVEDLMRGGLSGGMAPGVGGRGEVPERTMMPGYMKDVFGWYHHPVQELRNKMATAPRMVKESIENKDWKDQPIRDINSPTPDQVRQYFEYVYRSLGPISLRQLAKGQKIGSNITSGEALLGLRPTPQFLQDPEGYERMKKGMAQRDWQKKQRFDKRQERQYGGPQ